MSLSKEPPIQYPLTDVGIMSDFRRFRSSAIGHSDHLLLLYTYAAHIDKPRILEIGVRYGRSTQVLLAAADLTGGWVVSCDLDPEVPEVLPPEILNHPSWTFHLKDSKDLANEWTNSLDLLFIDGDHSYEGVKADFTGFSPFVGVPGFVVMHDAIPIDRISGVLRLVNEIQETGQWNVALHRVGGWTACLTRRILP